MDFGGSRFDLDSRIHVSLASVSPILLGAVVVSFSVVVSSLCTSALAGSFVASSMVEMLWRMSVLC